MGYGEAKNSGNVVLGGDRGIEKKNLRFGSVDRGTWGFREGVEKGFEWEGLLDWRVPEKHVIINKLLVGSSQSAMNRDTSELMSMKRILDKAT